MTQSILRSKDPTTTSQEAALACAVLDRYPDIPLVGILAMRPVVEVEALAAVFGEPLLDDERQAEALETVDDLIRRIANGILDEDFPGFGVEVVGLEANWEFLAPVQGAVLNGLRSAYSLMHENGVT